MKLLGANRGRRTVSRQLERARRLVYDGDAQTATALLVSLARRHPSDHEIWLELSRTSRARGRDEAVGYALRAADLAPTATEVLRELTLALAQDVERLDEAQQTIQNAIDLDDADPLNWTMLGVVRLAAGNTAGARLACKRGLAADPLCVDAHLVLADIAFAAGEWEEARSRFRLVLNLAPETLEAAESLAWLDSRPSRNGDTRQLVDQVGATFANTEAPVDDDAAAVDPVDTRRSALTRDDRTLDVTTPDASSALPVTDDAPTALSPPGSGRERGEDASGASRPGFPVRPSESRDLADVDVMDDEVLDVVHKHIEAYNERDMDVLLEGFAEDAVLRASGDVVVGRRELKELFANAFSDAENTVLQLNSTIVQNGVAACEMTESTKRYSVEQRSDLVGIYAVRGGKIVRVRLYHDA